jgi:hypothetical protein
MKRLLFFQIFILFFFPLVAYAAPPLAAVKFVILQPADSTVGTAVAVTIEAQKKNNKVDVDYQSDVTLVTSGSATGGGLVDITNGVGTISINDFVAETVTLSLSDTQSTGLDVSSTQDVVFSAPADLTAPSAISDLAALNAATSSIDISWTAPGDDGNSGTATAYDIRYRTNNITGGNWNSATQVSGEPTPQIAGTNQSMTVSGLAENIEYFFAIKTSDEAANESGLSNVVSATTLSSVPPSPQCSDGADNDNDGLIDFPADPGCTDASDTDETDIRPSGNAVWNQQKFIFRDDDGDEITATGFGAENVGQNTNIINIPQGTAFRLRFAIKLSQADGSIAPQFELKEGTNCATGDWNIITANSNNFNLWLSDNFTDSASTTQQLVDGPNFIAGQILESTNPAAALAMEKNQSTEYEWSLRASANIPFATTYSFRITNDGVSLDTYGQCPSLTIQGVPAPSPPPSGGHNREGGAARPTTVTFSGKAFPGATVRVVDKVANLEKVVSQDTVASDDGYFQTNFVGILQSQHSFGLIVKDKELRTAQTKFFNIDTLANNLTTKDIIISPTVGFANHSVTRGHSAILTGCASPGSNIIFEIDNKIKKEAKAGGDGSYKAEIDTGVLDFGPHRVRVKQVISKDKRESDFSPIRTFTVSRLSLPKADLSGDGKVSIKDWSIFLSRWSSKDSEKKKTIDLNRDGKVDVNDFSIFIKNMRRI